MPPSFIARDLTWKLNDLIWIRYTESGWYVRFYGARKPGDVGFKAVKTTGDRARSRTSLTRYVVVVQHGHTSMGLNKVKRRKYNRLQQLCRNIAT